MRPDEANSYFVSIFNLSLNPPDPFSRLKGVSWSCYIDKEGKSKLARIFLHCWFTEYQTRIEHKENHLGVPTLPFESSPIILCQSMSF